MGLYRRKNSPYWYMAFTAVVKGIKKIFNKSTGTTDEKTAKEIWRRLEAKIALGQWHPETCQKEQKPEYVFSDLVDKYSAWAAPRHKGWEAVERYIVQQLKKRFGTVMLNDFTTYNVEKFQSDELARGIAADTINRTTTTLKGMFSRATDWDMIDDAVLKRIRRAKQLTDVTHRLRFLSLEECFGLIDACDTHLRPIVITALNTALRKSNILNLRWDQVDLKHGFILLENKALKNKSRLEIPITEPLREALLGLTRRLDTPYVFYDPATCKPYRDVKKSFHSACRRAKIVDFHFHDLRHTAASHLLMCGVDLTTVKEILGHKSITMTLRYAHLAPSHKVEAMKKLGDLFSSKNLVQNRGKMVNYCTGTEVNSPATIAASATI